MNNELSAMDREELSRKRLDRTINRSTTLPDNSVYSATEQMGSSASQGFDDSLVFGQLPEVIKKVSAGYFDKNNNLEPLTDEQFEKKGYSIFGEDFKREPAETPTQTKYRFERYVQNRVNQQNVGGGGKLQTAANFAAGFAGGIGGDLPIAFVPYAAVASRVNQATNAMTKGATIARAAQVKTAATKASQLESAMASGSKLKVAGLVLKDYAKEAVIATTAETALWGASSTYLGDKVTGKDLLVNGAFSFGASGVFAPISLRSAFKKQNEIVDFNNNLETVSTFFEEGNTSAAAIKLVDFYEPAKQLARQNEEFAFLLNDKLEVTDLTPEQADLADKFFSEISLNETKEALARHLLNNVFSEATEGGPSQEDLARDIKSQTERIYKAMDDNAVHTLKERDWEALVLSGWQPSEQMQVIRNKYLEYIATPEYAEMSFYPALNADNKQTAKRILREYDGPAFEVVEDFDIDTLANVNPETGEIRLNPTRIKEDWDAGLPHLTGESDSASSPQKKIVFAKIDIEKFKEAVGSWEGYQKFILAHEQGHLALKHTRGKRADWLEEEAINKEIAANEYAAELLGIDWLSLAKGTDVPIAPFDPSAQDFTSRLEAIAESQYRKGDKRSSFPVIDAWIDASTTGLLEIDGRSIEVSDNTIQTVVEFFEERVKRLNDPNRPTFDGDIEVYKKWLKNLPSKDAVDSLTYELSFTANKDRASLKGVEISDGVPFIAAKLNWTKKKAGEVYGNIALCHKTSANCAFILKEAGVPSSVIGIAQKDTSGVSSRLGDHRVALTEIGGVRYILDQPQKELWSPLDKPKADTGVITTTEFEPRFIEFTSKNLQKYYGYSKTKANETISSYKDFKLDRAFGRSQKEIMETFEKEQGLPPKITPEENYKQSREKIIETFADDTIDPKPEPKQADIITEPVTRLERDQADYSLLTNDRKGFFVDQTNQVLGNEKVLGIIQSTPEGYDPVKDKGNYSARKKHVRTVLEENGLEQYSDVAESIVDTLGSYDFYLKSVNDFFEQYNPKNKGTHAFDTKGIPDDIKRSAYILLGENDGDPLKAQAAVIKSLDESKSALILRTVRDAKIENQLVDGANQYSTPKQRIEWLQTQLDGQQRAGIDSRSSFNTKSKAQVVIDAKPINDVLDKHGLWDLFIGAGSGPYMDVLRRQTGGNTDAIKIYGKDLRNHINDFAGDIMVAIRTGETPTKWKGVEAFEELVEAINGVRQSQLTQLNRNGSNVRVRSDFSGWSQRWSNDTVKKIGFDRWRTDMLNGVDWDATAKAHGGRLIRTDGKEVPFDKELYLKEWYYKITELREQTDGSDVAKSFEQSRMVVLKPAAEAKILSKYSGEQNLGKLLMDQIRYRSEMIASIETLGGNPLQTVQNTLDKSQLVRGDNIGKFKYDTVIGTTRLLTNDLDNPVDASFASIFKSVRKVGNLAFLPLSGFSALMDIPLSISTLKYTGAEITMSEYMPQFLEAMSRQFKGDKTGMSAYFRDVGAAYDVVNNASLRQITGDVSGEKGFLDLAMSFMFEANGMLRTTAAGQEAFADWTSRSLGREAAAGKFSDLRIESLKNFGFTDADIDVLLKSANKDAPDGISRVMPQTVEDGNVSTKLREYYLHYMKQAVLEPDAGAQAITRGNFKAGTVGGESMRTGFQYTSFILGLSRTLYGRFAHGYTGSQLNHIRAMSHLVAFVGTSLAAAWVVTVMKDLVRGKAPINPLNMGNFDMQRILMQSGLPGIGELPFELLGGGLPISPIAKAPLKVATGVVTADRKKVAKAVSPFVGGNLPVVGGPIKSMLSMAFLEAGQEFLKNEIDQINRL